MITDDEGHVTNIAVHPDRHRHGIGIRLMVVAMQEAIARGVRAMTLEVRMSNVAAQEMYRRFGFVPGGVRRNYYAEVGEDALIMWAHDVDSAEYARRLDGIVDSLDGPLRTEGVGVTGPGTTDRAERLHRVRSHLDRRELHMTGPLQDDGDVIDISSSELPPSVTVLGIETSCDETAAAVRRDGIDVLSSVVSSQIDLHARYGGVVPEIASRAHVELIIPVTARRWSRPASTGRGSTPSRPRPDRD